MVDLSNIRQFTIDRPDSWTLFGSPEDFDSFPEPHKAQILFLDKPAAKFIYEFSASAKLVTGDIWQPFVKGNFKKVERFSDFSDTAESKQELKKWLFHRGIAFQTWVFVLPNYNDYPILTTWKMVIKYSGSLFFSDDVTIFDTSLNWCLFFFHEDELFFGKDNIYDPTEDYQKMEALNEVKKKYPQFKFPY
jgi:hypothetical protein